MRVGDPTGVRVLFTLLRLLLHLVVCASISHEKILEQYSDFIGSTFGKGPS